jgi:hypothetical protein
MNVVFLALGVARRAAVVAEAARVVDAGGTVTVLLSQRSLWKSDPFPGGVEVFEVPELERKYRPNAVDLLLYRVPRRLLGDRLWKAFRWRIALPLDRRLARTYRRDAGEVRRKAILQAVLKDGSPDLVVVADAQSLEPAAELVSKSPGRRFDLAFYGPVRGSAG